MKQSLVCPKCQSRQLWMIEQVRQPQFDCGNLVIPVCVTATEQTQTWERMAAGWFEAWVCAQCGYSELYAKNANQTLAAMVNVENSGVKWIDTTPQRGPFR